MDYKINDNLLKILDYNLNCYEFKKFKFDKGLFDETVDATYIINLVGNGRYDNIINQINKYKPTSQVYILLNQGFKKCNKTKHIVVGLFKGLTFFFTILHIVIYFILPKTIGF